MSFYEVGKNVLILREQRQVKFIRFLLTKVYFQCDKKSTVDVSRNMDNLTSRTCPPHSYLCTSLSVWLMYKQLSLSTCHHLKCWAAPPTSLFPMFRSEVKEF